MKSLSKYDYIIVGAGPSGLLCGILLKKQNKSVLILEQSSELKRKVCGEYLCPQGVKLLDQLGFLEKMEQSFLPILGMRLATPFEPGVNTYFPETNSFKYKGISVNRLKFDSIFYEEYLNIGGEILFNEKVIDFKNHNDKTITLNTKSNEFNTNHLIAADGRSSSISRKLNLTKESKEKKVSLHCFLDKGYLGERLGEMHLLGEGMYAGIDPINDNEINFSVCMSNLKIKEMGTLKKSMEYAINKSEELKERFLPIPQNLKIHSTFPITHKTKSKYYPNISFVGDASGFIDPLTGEGIFNALWMAHTFCNEVSRNELKASKIYLRKKRLFFIQKVILNSFFQFLINRNVVIKWATRFILKKEHRKDVLIGIIGNVYSPLVGLLKLL